MRILLEEDMTALTVRIVAQDIEKHDRLEELPVLLAEAEKVIFSIVFDELLQRTGAKWTVLAQRGKRDDMQAKVLAYQVRRDFSSCKAVFGEIPKRLLSTQGLIDGGVFTAFMLDSNKERIVRAKGELPFDLIFSTLDSGS
jgi:hypothetical protein